MTENSPSPGNIAAIGFLAIVFVAFVYLLIREAAPVARRVPAEPYEWSPECKQAVTLDSAGNRRYSHVIPQACMDPRYRISDPRKYNLKYRGKGAFNYYRFGPDAVNVFCFNDGRCVVDDIERDVFSESGNRHE